MQTFFEAIGQILALIVIAIIFGTILRVSIHIVPCGTYLTDTNHYWIEVQQNDQKVASMRFECGVTP